MDVMWFEELKKDDVNVAGGKGANLGEMTQAGLPVPSGFVITSTTYGRFVKETEIFENLMEILGKTDVHNSKELMAASKELRSLIESTPIPSNINEVILKHYKELCKSGGDGFVAVRSSATAEDLPGASFAGQQDTFLNVKGDKNLLENVRKCWSSLFTPRAIFYREEQGFDHAQVLIAVVVQKMVNADKAGVMFSIHPATGNRDQIVIEGAWGLGEGVVSGTVSPDHYVVSKSSGDILEVKIAKKELMFTKDKETGKTIKAKTPADLLKKQVLSEKEIGKLIDLGKLVEDHYNFPQDMEWAFEGDADPFMLQSRPITVLYEDEAAEESEATGSEEIILKGLGSSPGTGSGKISMIFNLEEIDKVKEGNILVTTMTNPDMVPAMKRANAIVTEEGGMTCHAAIVSRELGIPCIVGTGTATKILKTGEVITVDGSRGVVYRGASKKKAADAEEKVAAPAKIVTGTEVKVNLSVPDERIARKVAKLADGVGLLRVEHIILGMGRHPMSFIRAGEEDLFIEGLSKDLRIVVDAFYPHGTVYIRTLDAPTDEFKNMKGGEDEPDEPNPMLGWRGIRRGIDEPDLLRTELKAIKKLVDENYHNIGVMVPLVHHPKELRRAKELALEVGLVPHKDVQFGIMVETPASALIIDDFIAEGLDFISFGTNDLTQYTLALDRNNERVAKHYSEKHPAVLKLIKYVIERCNKAGVTTSICGQAGSDPEVVAMLVQYGITSVSANPDAILTVRETVKRAEIKLLLEAARGN